MTKPSRVTARTRADCVLIAVLVGAAITVVTFVAASMSEGGGHFVITYGLMFVGGGNFLYGLLGWLGETRKSAV